VVSRFDEPLIGLRLFGDTLSPSLIDVDSLTPRRRGFAERGACVNCRTPRLHLTAKREGKGGRSRPFLYYLSRHRGNSHGRTTRRSLNGRRPLWKTGRPKIQHLVFGGCNCRCGGRFRAGLLVPQVRQRYPSVRRAGLRLPGALELTTTFRRCSGFGQGPGRSASSACAWTWNCIAASCRLDVGGGVWRPLHRWKNNQECPGRRLGLRRRPSREQARRSLP
jgi:hypothetical protein